MEHGIAGQVSAHRAVKAARGDAAWPFFVYRALHSIGAMRPISTLRSSPLPRMVVGPLL